MSSNDTKASHSRCGGLLLTDIIRSQTVYMRMPRFAQSVSYWCLVCPELSMNRPRSESVREGKLRAACDRCHDLKNRCVRIGGPDSRCDRCERLDIDCVYQESSRMGRPKRQRKTSSFQPPQPDQESHQRMPSTTSDRMPEMSVAVATGPELNVVQMEADTSQSGSTTLIDSPSEAMRFLMSPKGWTQLPIPDQSSS